jgi:HSP20 family molecular chaperone IbpA
MTHPYSCHPVFPPSPHGWCVLDVFDDGSNQLRLRDHTAKISFDDQGNFTYQVDVSGFGRNELTVDIEGDDIKIKGEHKASSHHEEVERSFARIVRIPKGILKDTIKCHVDNKGHLTLVGTKVPEVQSEKRSIPIEMK